MSETAAWARLDAELSAWTASGRAPWFWWRDDDAGDATPALCRLLALAETHGVPLALATVPAWSTPALAAAVAGSGGLVTVLQHGYAHANYAPAGEKKSEIGPERPAPHVVAEIAEGWQRLEARFGRHVWPVLVPPWNRMAGYLPPFLAELRYRGLSQFGPRVRREAAKGLVQANAHVDIVYWKGTAPRFAGAEKSLAEFARHLAARRSGEMDAAEPIGLLTHHAAQDDDCWAFLEALFRRLARRSGIRWLAARAVFADAGAP